ncbi:MAG: NAD(P)/FAD-dependent oxidoreductase [Oscillospiraceae bacterium]|nr:NAD(P)/FAD-dependent oxidoreductase [Oscillospiraceae bacterium]
MYDVVIIGKGPAGIQASLYTRRAGLKTLVIGSGGGSLEKAEKIENYYGLGKPISGKELLENGISQAKRIGVEVVSEEIFSVEYENGIFNLHTSMNKYSSKAVIIATGTNRKSPNIKGITEFEGRGVSYCAVCDAFFYKNKNVAVLGNGAYALSEVDELLPVTNSVVILTNGKEEVLPRNDNIKCNTKEITEFRGSDKIEKVVFNDKSELKVDGVFIAEGIATSLDLARKIGINVENNKIIVNENMETSIPGLYAAGDCTGGLLQVSKAVYEGTKAGLSAIGYVRSKVTV